MEVLTEECTGTDAGSDTLMDGNLATDAGMEALMEGYTGWM